MTTPNVAEPTPAEPEPNEPPHPTHGLFARYHWRHYFGGVALTLLLAQLLSGIFLAFYYQPHLKEAYDSIRNLYNHFPVGAQIREAHRWLAMAILMSAIIHSLRSWVRRDYQNHHGKVLWLTGALMIPLLLGFLATGFILPWEWRAYWFMEMIPNLLGNLPLVGPAIKTSLIELFTMPRTLIVHTVVLPLAALILIDYHILAKIRRRKGGIARYLRQHALLTVPFFIAVAWLVIKFPTPTQDPELLPDPLEGTYLPTVEWFLLVFWLPFLHFGQRTAVFLGLYLPLLLFAVLAWLPYWLRRRRHAAHRLPSTATSPVIVGAVTVVLTVVLFGSMYAGTYRSPTLGCNACHNVALGTRMGIPPEAFKDRAVLPLLDKEDWMVLHWFVPQKVW